MTSVNICKHLYTSVNPLRWLRNPPPAARYQVNVACGASPARLNWTRLLRSGTGTPRRCGASAGAFLPLTTDLCNTLLASAALTLALASSPVDVGVLERVQGAPPALLVLVRVQQVRNGAYDRQNLVT